LETQTSLSSEGIPIFCYLLVDQFLWINKTLFVDGGWLELLAVKDWENKIEFGISMNDWLKKQSVEKELMMFVHSSFVRSLVWKCSDLFGLGWVRF
jgi:hypothetical protein